MGGTAVSLLRAAGACLVLLAGYGGGRCVWLHHRAQWRQLHTFARLLLYLQGVLRYQPLTGADLLRRAGAYPEFAELGLKLCTELAGLPLPAALPAAQREELNDGLRQISLQPREEACATLGRMAALCEDVAQRAQREAEAARALWPRLGLCGGVLAVILLW